MRDWSELWLAAFRPRGPEWWLPLCVGAAVGLLVLSLIALYLPMGRAPRLPGVERAVVCSWWRRWLTRAMLTCACLLPVAVVLVLASPARPVVLLLNRPGPGTTPAAGERIPFKLRSARRIEVRPLVHAALARLMGEGAAAWFEPSAAWCDEIRRACVAVIHELAAGDNRPLTNQPPEPVPPWVEEAVELTIVRALTLLERCAWIGVDAGPQRLGFGWDAGARVFPADGLVLDLSTPPEDEDVKVRILWDGRLDPASDKVQFWAVVSGSPGPAGRDLAFRIQPPDGSSSQAIRFSEHLAEDGKTCRRFRVEHTAADLPQERPLRVYAESSGACVNLVEQTPDGSSPALVLQLPGSWGKNQALEARLRRVWTHFLEAGSDLREDLARRHGWQVPDLIAVAGDGPSLVLEHGAILILPPGVQPDQVPRSLWETPAGEAGPTTVPVPSYAFRITSDGRQDVDSWIAQDAPAGKQPPSSYRSRSVAFQTTSTLAEGRFKADQVKGRPVVDCETVDGRLVTIIHLDAERDLLAEGALSRDPSRLRAFLSTVVVAANEAVGGLAASVEQGQTAAAGTPRGSCLLTEQDMLELRELGQRATDRWGTGLCATYFMLLAVHTGLWLHRGSGRT